MRNNRSLGVLLIVLALAFSGLKLKLDEIPRTKIPGASVLYLPSGKYLKAATFGYSSLAADIIYIWAIQYYGDSSVSNRFDYFTRIFSVISDLDPHYLDPYEIGALIAINDMRSVPLALKVLDMGFAKNPDQWILPLEAGHYAQLYEKDYALAKEYYEKAMSIKGAPAVAKRLYAASAYKTTDLKTAWETWIEVYRTATDEQIKKIASNHLYEVKAAADIGGLKAALEKFKERYGHFPDNLGQLVSAGIISGVPKDLDDKDYLYDKETGEVRTSVIPWKR